MRLFLLIIFILPCLCYSAHKQIEVSGVVESEVYENPNRYYIDRTLNDNQLYNSDIISLGSNEVFHLISIQSLDKDAQLSLDTDASYLKNDSPNSGNTYTNSLQVSRITGEYMFNNWFGLVCSYDGYDTQRKIVMDTNGEVSTSNGDDPYIATLYGPGDINLWGGGQIRVHIDDNANASYVKVQGTASAKLRIVYEVSKVGSTPSEEKFSVALDDDGSRLAIGTKDGTNTVVRVYEYDGSSWSQLGEDVEQ